MTKFFDSTPVRVFIIAANALSCILSLTDREWNQAFLHAAVAILFGVLWYTENTLKMYRDLMQRKNELIEDMFGLLKDIGTRLEAGEEVKVTITETTVEEKPTTTETRFYTEDDPEWANYIKKDNN